MLKLNDMSYSKGILPNKKRPLVFLSFNNTSNLSISENFNISYVLPSETIWPWCDYWKEPQHILMQLAQICFLIGYLSYTNTKGVIIMRIFIIIGMILMSFWSWHIICAPDVFVWSFIFNVMNSCQVMYSIYKMRPVKFNSEFEDLYNVLFAPFKVSRTRFKRMISNEYATVSTLYSGDAYATQNLTKTNKLSLLISGKVNVYTNNQLLHNILPYEFLDSPEFETSGSNYDEKFKVTIVAVTTCRFICWQREILEYLFTKEPYIATVLNTLIARDISAKLYAMNNKFINSNNNKYIDIRLPSVSSMLSTINDELLIDNKNCL